MSRKTQQNMDLLIAFGMVEQQMLTTFPSGYDTDFCFGCFFGVIFIKKIYIDIEAIGH